MSRDLLDTNILSDLVTSPQGVVAERILREGESNVCTSVIVAAELRYGARKRNSRKLTDNLEAILTAIDVLPFEEPADRAYGEVRAALESRGEVIGPNDLLIAAHALSLDKIVVTANNKEFGRVHGLRVENWLDSQ